MSELYGAWGGVGGLCCGWKSALICEVFVFKTSHIVRVARAARAKQNNTSSLAEASCSWPCLTDSVWGLGFRVQGLGFRV